MKKFYFFLAALCCAVMSLMPQRAKANPTVTEKGIMYELMSNENKVSIYTCDASVMGDVVLPAYVKIVKDRPVVKISKYAFTSLNKTTYITTPFTLTEIEASAFKNAIGLKEITLNAGITEIGSETFMGCINLQKINLPTTIGALKSSTFSGCTSLTEIYIPKNILSIGFGVFKGCENLTTVQGMSGVSTIDDWAFIDCKKLTTVNLGLATSLKSIGRDAFMQCLELKKITLPASLSEIGEGAFSFTSIDTIINLSTTPQFIYANVFTGCKQRASMTLIVPKGCKEKYEKANIWKEFGEIIELGDHGAPDPSSTIPSGKYKIGDLYYSLSTDQDAVVVADESYATGLSGSLHVPSTVTCKDYTYTVTGIGKQAFKQCTLLTDVYLPNTITSIGDEAFSGCSNLYGGTILPASVTSLGEKVFENCTVLSSIITMPDAITVVPDYCFSECEKLPKVKLSPATTEIGNRAFFGCYALTTITFPSTLKSIQYYSFAGCTNIATIICEEKTPPSYIKEYSFYAATSLFENCVVYVPKGCLSDYKSDENWKNWKKLREIGSNEKIKYGDVYYQLKDDGTAYATYEVKESADNYKSLSGEVTVAEVVPYQGLDYTVISVGPSAFQNCKGITKVNLPEHLEEISGDAFKNCTALEDANIPANVVWLNNSAFEGSALFTNNKDEDGAVYYGNCLLYYTKNSVSGTYKVKDGTRMIAARVFEGDEKITELIVPEGVRRVLTNSIESMYGLQTLRLPSTLEFIGVNFCNDCFYLTKIYNFRKKPFDLSENNCFDNVNTGKCTLYVPYGSSNEYNNAVEWKEFTVVEMGQLFTVEFEDWDGTVIQTETVEEGNDAHKPEKDPSREGYNFTGWSPSYENVKSNLVITAQYERKQFTVRFYDNDKTTLLKEEQVGYMLYATAPEEPTHEGYHFTDWDTEFDVITSDLDVYAQYEINKYTVRFFEQDGMTQIGEDQTINWNEAATAPEEKDIPAVEGYHFTGWDTEFDHVKADLDIKAVYEINKYTVTFVDYDGETVLKSEEVEHGSAATAPEDPTRENYTFTGWDKKFDNITADLTVQAQYELAVVYFTVTYYDWDLTLLGTEQVEEGKDAKGLDPEPTREGYTFTGWSKPLTNITSDLSVQAQYEEIVEVDYTPKNLKAVLTPQENDDVLITLSWDKVDGAASYELRVTANGNELFSQNTMTLNVIASKLSDIEKDYKLIPGTYTINWFVRSTDVFAKALSDWAQGESFEVTVKDTGTGIEAANSQKPTANSQKLLIDGQLYILRGNDLFSPDGRLVK